MPGVDCKSFLHTRVCLVLTTVLFFACICFIWIFASAYFENIEELNYPLWVEPEQIHLSLGVNASQMVVTWTTFKATNSSVVLYGKNGLDRIAHGEQSKFIDGGLERRVIYIHRVYLRNLEANETYQYFVGCCNNHSRVFFFTTFPEYEKTNWAPQLALFGDLSVPDGRIFERLQSEVAKKHLDMIFHLGDFAYDLHDDNGRVGDAFMRRMESIAAYVPYQTCPGNHEEAYNFSHYSNRFSMHSEGDPSIRNHYWSYNLGPAHIISFSTEFHFFTQYGTHQILNQYRWLEEDLRMANLPENRAKHPWIITMGHRPMYSQFANPFNRQEEIVRLGNATFPGFEKLFYKYGVDLCFWGHIHNYERLWPIYNGTVRNGSLEEPYTNPKAPVHIITGAAGTRGMTPILKTNPLHTAFTSTEYGYTRLSLLNSTTIHLQQTKEHGGFIDEFYLIKAKHGPEAWL